MATIIAEFCQNHGGDRAVLLDMIHAAAEAGADYAKIQSIRTSELTRRERFEEGVTEGGMLRAIRRPYQPEHARLAPLELHDEDHVWFIEECGRAGIKPLTTVFTRAAIPFVASLSWDAVKVASYDCASRPMLLELRDRFEHLFVSTGATYDGEIESAAEVLGSRGTFSLLHCVTIYPTPLEEMHLARLRYLRRFTGSVGFSDHSLVGRDGNKASIVALSLGVDVIERHFTVLPADATRDGPVSINPPLLAELVRFARMPTEVVAEHVNAEIPEAPVMQGEASRPMSPAELLNRDYYRGRFASHVDGEPVYNWEDRPLEAVQ